MTPKSFNRMVMIWKVERDEQFINELVRQLLVDLREACHWSTSLCKPKSTDTKTNLIYKHALSNYL